MGTATVVAGLALTAYGEYQGIKAASASAKYDAQIARNNAAVIEERIKDVRGIGAQVVKQLERGSIQIAADQVTAYAGENIDVSSAVVREKVEETARVGSADVITTLHNIEKDVWGLKVGKMNAESLAMFNEARGKSLDKLAPIAAGTTLLTGLGALFATRQKTPKTKPLPREAFPPTFDITANPFK